MKKVIGLAVLLSVSVPCFADPLIWSTPFGVVNFNLTTLETGMGYDGYNKKAVAIASVPVYSLPRDILALQLGVDGAWPTGNAPLVEPYVAAGHDLLREIPVLANYKSAHLNIFGRWDTTNGKPGVGASFTYAFGGSPALEPTINR